MAGYIQAILSCASSLGRCFVGLALPAYEQFAGYVD
jgi:hypothetical protein